ncbi:MAG: acyloxyacyl hydrolase [Bacteroidota bacterium]
MMRRLIGLGLGLLLAGSSVWGQTEEDSVRTRQLIGLRGHSGFIILHSQDLRPIEDSYPWGAELDFGWQYVSKRAWEFCNCYPRAGAALTFWNWDNRTILGHGITAIAYVEPVFLTRHRFNLSIRMGGGPGFLTRPHDPVENPNNLSYSTRLNMTLLVNVGFNYRLTNRWNLRLAANYNHVSNGGLQLPNKGINYPTASLGADYALQEIDFVERAKRLDRRPPEKRLRLYTTLFYSFKNAIPGVARQYGIYGFGGKGVYYVGRWSGLSLGAEWVLDHSRRARIRNENLNLDHQRGSVLVGHQFLLGRVVFSQQFGVYLYDRYQVDDPVYQRIGLLFHFTENFYAGINLKTHRHVADFGDLRVGWVF